MLQMHSVKYRINTPWCQLDKHSYQQSASILLSVLLCLILLTSMLWLTVIGQLNCKPPVPCALINGAFCLF